MRRKYLISAIFTLCLFAVSFIAQAQAVESPVKPVQPDQVSQVIDKSCDVLQPTPEGRV